MIHVILARSSRRILNDLIFPVFDYTGGWCGMSTACDSDGNGRKDRPWCSFCQEQTWINTETHESIIITDEFLINNTWNLSEYGIKEFKKLLRPAAELEPETEMPDIF